jgi:biopolymer transport protein ExbD
VAGSNDHDDEFAITAINVTPFVDIMLVLLVIFMVTATFIVKEAIEVELPKAAAGGETTAKTLALVITKDGKVYLDGVEVSEEALLQKVKESQQAKEDMQAIIGADKEATHGAVVHVLDMLKAHGITKFAIQIEKKS